MTVGSSLVAVLAVAHTAASPTLATGPTRVHEMAKPTSRPAGAPRYSDVCMRLFRKHEGAKEIKAGKAFHITYAVWSYILEKDYIQAVHDLGWRFQGTMNGVTNNAEFAMKDKNGKPMRDHFNTPGRYWADMRNEAYREWYVNRLREWIDAGADAIQRDEPTTVRHTPIPAAVAFFKDVHARVSRAVDRRVPMSCNLAWNPSMFGAQGEPLTRLFDFGMTEVYRKHLDPGALRAMARDADVRGKGLVCTGGETLDVSAFRLAVAGCYANGMQFIVPWDQFAGIGKPRVFAKPEELADLYGFVRAVSGYLDGYEAAWHAIESGESAPTLGDRPLVVSGGTGRIDAWIRAKPGNADAPVVVHLVEWGAQPAPFTVALNPARFFGAKPMRVRLLTPVPYDRATHETAEQTKDYSPLARLETLETRLEHGAGVITVAPLTPWGMLVVEQAPPRE